jgi:hypothetical protein
MIKRVVLQYVLLLLQHKKTFNHLAFFNKVIQIFIITIHMPFLRNVSHLGILKSLLHHFVRIRNPKVYN